MLGSEIRPHHLYPFVLMCSQMWLNYMFHLIGINLLLKTIFCCRPGRALEKSAQRKTCVHLHLPKGEAMFPQWSLLFVCFRMMLLRAINSHTLAVSAYQPGWSMHSERTEKVVLRTSLKPHFRLADNVCVFSWSHTELRHNCLCSPSAAFADAKICWQLLTKAETHYHVIGMQGNDGFSR